MSVSRVAVAGMAVLLFASCSRGGETGWTVKFDFNDGAVGEKVPGLDAGGGTKYTTEQSFEGGRAAVLHARRGQENWGRWGGRVFFPKNLRKGDEVWWRVRTFWPKGMDYSAQPWLKFLRIHTCSAAKKNQGYDDIYINKPGSKTPFRFIYEGESKWSLVGTAKDVIVPDRWETYEFYVKLDDRSTKDGGQARIRFWKNGELLADITDRKTLKTGDDYADAALLFTYWNSDIHARQVVYEPGGGPFKVGESVTCKKCPDLVYRVEAIRPKDNTVFLGSTAKWKTPQFQRRFDALKMGNELVGGGSGNTCTVQKVAFSHPTMDIEMFVDDMILTCKTPPGRDAHGNPCIGMGANRSGQHDAKGKADQAGEDKPIGIAAKYVRDRGIAKDPAVVFSEDFEDEDLPARGWYDLCGWKKRLLITDEDKATGSKCMKIVYPKGSTGPWFRAPHFKHGYETMYVRYYRKWADGWDWGGPGDGNGHDTRLVANGPELPKQAYKGNDLVVLMMESSTHFAPWKRGVFGLMLLTARKEYLTDAIRASRGKQKAYGHKLGGTEWWLATTDRSRSPQSRPGVWYCVEYMGKMNTPGKADGEIKGWIDGKLIYHVQNCMIRDGETANTTWRRWWVGPYFHGGTTKDQHSYLDSLVVATEYIGPIRQEEGAEAAGVGDPDKDSVKR